MLEYEWVGPPESSPPLVFLHEGLGSVSTWGEFPRALSLRTGRGGLVYSRHGYGGSDAPDARLPDDFMRREALEVLPALLSRLNVRAPVLIGHSDGASIALVHAASNPVSGLVLEAPHVLVEPRTLDAIAALRRRFDADERFRAGFGRHHADARRTVEAWSDAWLGPSFRAWTIEAELPRVSCPVLLIQAENDPYGSLEHIRTIASSVRGRVDTMVLPGTSHAPHRDSFRLVMDRMTRFIDGLDSNPRLSATE
jgi:pimeloyl-ACP methyl ester carboxylesterase